MIIPLTRFRLSREWIVENIQKRLTETI